VSARPNDISRCPQVIALSLSNLGGWYFGLELDVLSLRRFAYRGFLEPFTLMSPPLASMARAPGRLQYYHEDLFPAIPIDDRTSRYEVRQRKRVDVNHLVG
jgi:hypothetical protein